MLSRYVHYLGMALRSFRRNWMLTALVIVAIALGIGATMITQTVLYLVSGDPLPGRSDTVYNVQLDAAGSDGYLPGDEPALQLTRYDAETLLRAKRADRQAMMSGGSVVVEPQRAGLDPFYIPARYTSADFFPMFDVPFAHGGPWSAAEDDSRARVAVISRELSSKLFDGASSVGKTIRLNQDELRIVGVLDDWRPTPRFYDVFTAAYDQSEQVFVPFSTARDLHFDRSGKLNCWADAVAEPDAINAPCTWVQFWVQLAGRERASAYRDFLISYSKQQGAAGRFERPPNVRLRDVMAWLDFQRVVPSDVRLQTWLALGFLVVCLLNAMGLLLARFLRRSPEIGVRRALGASRKAIFGQFLVEAATVGLFGGVLGLGLTWVGLWAVRHQPVDYAAIAELDLFMLAVTFGLAIVSSLLAGLLPAWRACQVPLASQLKSQ